MTKVLRSLLCGLLPILFTFTDCTQAVEPVAELLPTVDSYRQLAKAEPKQKFQVLDSQVGNDGLLRQLASFASDDLTQYALILWPKGHTPEGGWPLLVFNHGFHPDPLQHGVIDGKDARPGAYYWKTVQAYAHSGYVVVAPDYRGHNNSEGAEYTQRKNPLLWYTRDSINAFKLARQLPAINTRRCYMMGHSMGGPITQSAILALGDALAAASIWSGSAHPLNLEAYWPQLNVPLIIQHGNADQSTNVTSSLALAKQLQSMNRAHESYMYNTSEHLFTGTDFDDAIGRDLAWFEQYGKQNP